MRPGWYRQETSGDLVFNLHIQPGAKKTEIVGLHGDALKIRLAAAPVDGKANASLAAYLAKQLDVPRSQVELISGAASRKKRLRVKGAAARALAEFLSRAERTAAQG